MENILIFYTIVLCRIQPEIVFKCIKKFWKQIICKNIIWNHILFYTSISKAIIYIIVFKNYKL